MFILNYNQRRCSTGITCNDRWVNFPLHFLWGNVSMFPYFLCPNWSCSLPSDGGIPCEVHFAEHLRSNWTHLVYIFHSYTTKLWPLYRHLLLKHKIACLLQSSSFMSVVFCSCLLVRSMVWRINMFAVITKSDLSYCTRAHRQKEDLPTTKKKSENKMS